MPRYRVTLEGHLIDEWEVEADGPADAEAKVRKGKGSWTDQQWADNPQTTKIERVERIERLGA